MSPLNPIRGREMRGHNARTSYGALAFGHSLEVEACKSGASECPLVWGVLFLTVSDSLAMTT